MRATEQGNFLEKGRMDFTVRKHGFSSEHKYITYGALALIIAGVGFSIYSNAVIGIVTAVLLGVGLFIYAKHMQSCRMMLTNTEFLSALFSAALSDEFRFCMIVKKKTGEIIYLNQTFQKMFPEVATNQRRMFSMLLDTYRVAPAQKKDLITAVTEGKKESIKAQVEGGKDRKVYSIEWFIQPISRPSGFCLVRGQEEELRR